jgi:hypothetical protein
MARNSVQLITCEHPACSETTGHEEAHSSLVVLQKVDKNGYTYHQCEQGQEVNYLNFQHWHCSHEHMQSGLTRCINEHYAESDLHPPIAGTTILHRVVLSSHLLCKTCNAPLTDVAYRFCLTLATPINHVPDESQNELGEWCCSLDHARQSALSIIASIEAVTKEMV